MNQMRMNYNESSEEGDRRCGCLSSMEVRKKYSKVGGVSEQGELWLKLWLTKSRRRNN